MAVGLPTSLWKGPVQTFGECLHCGICAKCNQCRMCFITAELVAGVHAESIRTGKTAGWTLPWLDFPSPNLSIDYHCIDPDDVLQDDLSAIWRLWHGSCMSMSLSWTKWQVNQDHVITMPVMVLPHYYTLFICIIQMHCVILSHSAWYFSIILWYINNYNLQYLSWKMNNLDHWGEWMALSSKSFDILVSFSILRLYFVELHLFMVSAGDCLHFGLKEPLCQPPSMCIHSFGVDALGAVLSKHGWVALRAQEECRTMYRASHGSHWHSFQSVPLHHSRRQMIYFACGFLSYCAVCP